MRLIKNLFILVILYLVVFCCKENSPNDLSSIKILNGELGFGVELDPKLFVEITLDSIDYFHENNILINLTIKNIGDSASIILYDHPQFESYGPWATSIDVFNRSNDSLVIEFPDASRLSSQFPSLENYHKIFPANGILKDEIYLYKIIYTGDRENRLNPGEYYMQLSYLGVKSNAVNFNLY